MSVDDHAAPRVRSAERARRVRSRGRVARVSTVAAGTLDRRRSDVVRRLECLAWTPIAASIRASRVDCAALDGAQLVEASGLGPRARIRADRHRRSATSTRPRSACSTWLAAGRHGDDGLYGAPRRRARAAGRAGAGHAARDHRAHELPAAAGRRLRERELQRLARTRHAQYVSRYARGRDYHKVLRARLQALADRIAAEVGPFGYRVFTDSAPVLEVALAREVGPRLARQAHAAADARRGLDVLPRRDLHRPAAAGRRADGRALRQLHALHRRLPDRRDRRAVRARRAALHLLPDDRARGPIPEELRPLIGNRVYGCDDCQLVCPWNQFAQHRGGAGLRRVRNGLDARRLVELFAWTRSGIRRAHWQAARSAASATSAGCATSRSGSATHRRRQSQPLRCAAG